MKNAELSHIHIEVGDLTISLNLYVQKLGLELRKVQAEDGREYPFISLSKGSIEFDVGGLPKAERGTTIGITVESVDEVYKRLLGQVLQPPREQPWGSYNCYVKDPDG